MTARAPTATATRPRQAIGRESWSTRGGSVDLQNTHILYAATALHGDPGSSLSVNNSVISNATQDGIDGVRLRAVRVTGTRVSDTGGPAMMINSDELDPSKLSGNAGTTTDGGLQLAGTFSRSGTLHEDGLWAQIGTEGRDDLTIARGVTLSLPAGEIVYGTRARSLIVNGTLIGRLPGSSWNFVGDPT